MNETIDKLNKQITALQGEMDTAYAALSKEGVSDEDKKKHIAEFNTAEAKLKDARESRDLAVRKRDADAAEIAFRDAEAAPGRRTLSTGFNNPFTAPNAGKITLAASARQHGPLVAFKGADAAEQAFKVGVWGGAALFGNERCKALLAEMGGRLQKDDTPSATLNTLDNSKGGYFVPDEMDRAIIRLISEEYGAFRRLARVVPMGSDSKEIPRNIGGMVAYFTGEGQKPPSSDPRWNMIQLVAKKLAAMTKITDELDEDSIVDFGELITQEAALAFAEKEDLAGFLGDGTAAYGGIVGLFVRLAMAENAASVFTAANGKTTLASLTLADYDAILGMYPNYKSARPYWLTHKEVYHNSMVPLELAAGGTTPADIRAGRGGTFRGYPVEFIDAAPTKAQATAGTIPIVFGDLKLSSAFGDRRTNRTLKRGYENDDFTRGLTTLVGSERFDIINHTITDPRSNGAKAGPVVGLKLAAA